MKYTAALKYYKTHTALAAAAGVSKQAVTRWAKTGLVPEASAYRLNARTVGKLKVHPEDYKRGTAAPAQPA